MGLFGLFATMFSGGVYVAENFKETSYAANKREQARREGKITYGVGGRDYLTSTGEQVFVRGGKVYSLKNNQVIYDMDKAYYMEQNKKKLEEAKAKGKKYMLYYHPNPNSDRGYSYYPTEVSTLKRFELVPIVYMNKEIHGWDFAYYKDYIVNNKVVESIQITKEEFEELGGYIPYNMTPEEYLEKKDKENEKFFKSIK